MSIIHIVSIVLGDLDSPAHGDNEYRQHSPGPGYQNRLQVNNDTSYICLKKYLFVLHLKHVPALLRRQMILWCLNLICIMYTGTGQFKKTIFNVIQINAFLQHLIKLNINSV